MPMVIRSSSRQAEAVVSSPLSHFLMAKRFYSTSRCLAHWIQLRRFYDSIRELFAVSVAHFCCRRAKLSSSLFQTRSLFPPIGILLHSRRDEIEFAKMCTLYRAGADAHCAFRLRGASARQVPPARGFGATSDFMVGLNYTTVIEFTEPLARRRGAALDR